MTTEKCNLIKHAKQEFLAAGYIPVDQPQEDGPNKRIQEDVLELLQLFRAQGHSGFSAGFAVKCFTKLANFEPLVPLQGTDDEWHEYETGKFQNKRCGRVFKDRAGDAYDIQGKIFREPSGSCYTSSESRVPVVFPYTPKTEYVDVPATKEE